jgi:hypothetical protein
MIRNESKSKQYSLGKLLLELRKHGVALEIHITALKPCKRK